MSASELSRYIAHNGFQAVEHLRGSFVVIAIASHANLPDDFRNHRIDCYRSRTGGRTAYYSCGSDGFSLSDSAFRVAHSRPGPARENPAWLAEFFALSNRFMAGLSPFEDVLELLPGEHLTITGGNARSRKEAEQQEFEYLDIPAFLRNQAD